MDLPWFRFYKDAVDDAKLKLLAFEDRWHFIALLCCKAQGLLDSDTPLARRKICIKLGLDSRELEEVVRRLAEVELVDAKTMTPLAWDKRQFKSDGDPTSAERQRRQRERNALRHASVTPTEQNREDTEAEKNTYSPEFERVWKIYPDRPGKSKAATYKAWNARLKQGEVVDVMTSGAVSYSAFCIAQGTEARFIKMPETFFGPSKFFTSDWTPPAQRGRNTPQPQNLRPADSPRIPSADESPDTWLRDDPEAAHA